MKKWLAVFFLFISVTCSAIPCCTFDECAGDELVSETDHETTEKGACSPFFSCTSCCGFTQQTRPLELSLPVIQKQVYYSLALPFHLFQYTASFWQPPRN